jgi:hypothetical protein
MAARERAVLRGRVRRALARPVPVVSAIAGLLGFASACLNPHPDEEPTFDGSKTPDQGTTDVAPPPETCADNPLLNGCGVGTGSPGPPRGGSGAGGSADAGTDGGVGTAGSAGSAGSAADAGAKDLSDAGPVEGGDGGP